MPASSDKRIVQALDATGLPWAITKGKRHRQVRLCGRLVGVLPHKGVNGDADQHAQKNVIGQIRRAAQEMKDAN